MCPSSQRAESLGNRQQQVNNDSIILDSVKYCEGNDVIMMGVGYMGVVREGLSEKLVFKLRREE